MPKEDRQRTSWRDIDKTRDRGGTRTEREPPQYKNREEERQQKQYRAALDALFEKGGIGKLADKLGGMPGFPRITPAQAVDPAPHGKEDEPADAATGAQAAPAEASPAAAQAAQAAAAASKKKGEDRLALRKKLLEATSRHEITKAAEKYLERFPLPDDHEFLEQLLEHEREDRALEAMGRIQQLLDDRHPPKRSRALCGKLRYLSETSSNDALREQAQALLRRLA